MIRFSNVNKHYIKNGVKTSILNNISFVIKKGDVFGILGQSGAGKSSLLRCMNLLETPSSGEIVVNKAPLHTLFGRKKRDYLKRIGMIYQHFNLLSSRNVFGG